MAAGAWHSRVWISEMPAIAALVATAFYCDHLVRIGRSRDAWAWAAWVVVGLVAKQLTTCMRPVYALHLVRARGWRGDQPPGCRPVAFIAGIGWEAIETSNVTVRGAGGYEEAARYIVQQSHGPTLVLFSGDDVDIGYFTFFMRRYDVDRHIVVVRANKILTTSYVNRVWYRDRIDAPEQIDDVFRELGIRFVVLEDRASASKVLNWLGDRLGRAPSCSASMSLWDRGRQSSSTSI